MINVKIDNYRLLSTTWNSDQAVFEERERRFEDFRGVGSCFEFAQDIREPSGVDVVIGPPNETLECGPDGLNPVGFPEDEL